MRRLRLRAQRLLRPEPAGVDSPESVLTAVGGVQAQDYPAGLLSLRARSEGLTSAQVEQARIDEHSIAWTWCLRGTLHLISAADALWLVPFLGPQLIAGDERRLFGLGWNGRSTDFALSLLQNALLENGELSRSEIRRLFQENNLPYEGQAPVHLIYRAALEGRLLRGALNVREEVYVPFRSWVGELQPLPRAVALARLAERYLAAYAPAAPADLAKWSGLKIGEARQAFQLISGQLVEVDAAGKTAWLLESQLPWLEDVPDQSPVVNLLPRFDTYLLGYASRDWMLEAAYAARVLLGGIIKPALLVDGEVRGIWELQQRKNGIEIKIEPFDELDPEMIPLIDVEIAEIERFLKT